MTDENCHRFSVFPTDVGQRLDQFLVRQFKEKYSRSYLQYLISEGNVLVNGERVKRHEKVRGVDRIEVILKEKSDRPWLAPEPIPLDIVHEDGEILVVNKPSGMVVHPACGHYTGTLVHALLAHCRTLSREGGQERPGIVHRLDKETSGLILVAKTDQAHLDLSRQFARRQVKKKYLAIVKRRMEQEQGTISLAVGRHPKHRQRMDVISPGQGKSRQAQTRFSVLKCFKSASYLELRPITGRTHQIRVHLAAIGHPILGDKIYGGSFLPLKVPRLALHASSLTFIHPESSREMTFELPLPGDLQEILKQIACL